MEGSVPVDYLMTFTDVENTWYTEAIRWAASEGIVSGTTDTTYSPNSMISRQQMVVMLYRYATWLGMDTSSTADITGFSDNGKVEDYAYDALTWAYGVGIISGNADGTLNPIGNATRAEAATMLQNFLSIDY